MLLSHGSWVPVSRLAAWFAEGSLPPSLPSLAQGLGGRQVVPACGSCISWGDPVETAGWHRVVPLGLVPGVPSCSPVEPHGAAGCVCC